MSPTGRKHYGLRSPKLPHNLPRHELVPFDVAPQPTVRGLSPGPHAPLRCHSARVVITCCHKLDPGLAEQRTHYPHWHGPVLSVTVPQLAASAIAKTEDVPTPRQCQRMLPPARHHHHRRASKRLPPQPRARRPPLVGAVAELACAAAAPGEQRPVRRDRRRMGAAGSHHNDPRRPQNLEQSMRQRWHPPVRQGAVGIACGRGAELREVAAAAGKQLVAALAHEHCVPAAARDGHLGAFESGGMVREKALKIIVKGKVSFPAVAGNRRTQG